MVHLQVAFRFADFATPGAEPVNQTGPGRDVSRFRHFPYFLDFALQLSLKALLDKYIPFLLSFAVVVGYGEVFFVAVFV